jgi:hypothetical protein
MNRWSDQRQHAGCHDSAGPRRDLPMSLARRLIPAEADVRRHPSAELTDMTLADLLRAAAARLVAGVPLAGLAVPGP